MAITQSVAASFKTEILRALHDFTVTTGHVFKLALYSSSATLNSSTTAYSATNEITGTGYSAGGGTLTSVTPALDGTTAVCDFADLTFTTATITARGALIYNSSASNRAVAVYDFGADKASTAADFTLVFPTAAAATAILRIA